MASKVLPQPGPPHISVGLPVGNPPSRISSRPCIPVGDLGSFGLVVGVCFGFVMLRPCFGFQDPVTAGRE
jgi:hypothetical protein